MRILLLGEYSNVHWTLAEGLRQLGHSVTVASNGDFWKGYQRDISLTRRGYDLYSSSAYYLRLIKEFRRFKGYDIVQIINPMFLELKAERIFPFYTMLRENNRRIFLGAFGMDYYYIKSCLQQKFPYSELVVNNKFRDIADNISAVHDWRETKKGELNQYIARDCDGIVCGLWEYYMSYVDIFPDKTSYIPLPINLNKADNTIKGCGEPIALFIGVQKQRSQFKGTDILLPILERIVANNPDKVTLTKAENMPYSDYCRALYGSDILVDQLYSPTPNMNSLLAMSHGIAVAGGGEECCYEILGEKSLRPIINLPCNPDKILSTLEELIQKRDRISELKRMSFEFVKLHHNHIKVAQQYVELWNQSSIS